LVYTVHLSIFMLCCRFRWSGLNAFFFQLVFSFQKSRRCDDNQHITVSHFGEHKRLHLESSKQNCYIISLRTIIKAIFIHSTPVYIPKIYSNGSSSPQWACSQRFNSIASAWVSHATGILVNRLTIQGSYLDDPCIVSLYTSRVCLCPSVITPRGFTSLSKQEAEYIFSWFGPTNKKTNKGHGNLEIMTSKSHYTG